MNTEWLTEQILQLNVPVAVAQVISLFLFLLGISIIAAVATVIVRRTLLSTVVRWIQRKNFRWGIPLFKNNFFSRLIWYVPLAVFAIASDSILSKGTTSYLLSNKLVMSGFVIISIISISALLTSLMEIDLLFRKTKRSILQGYSDALKIVTYVLGSIFIISIFTGKSPWGILSVLGGLTAVTMLVFKDSILGFVASIQLSASDLVRLGDWIEMPQYGADGDVISISIHTVKVQNFDKTISTIPTYALVSNSFKNWRGMKDSPGRRIKRSLFIDLHSIRFCDDQLLAKISNVELLREHIKEKKRDIAEYNVSHGYTNSSDILLNGRRQTNIGIFRAYIGAYLKNNPNIRQDMTFLVRQLQPTDHGLPLEIYVFSRDQIWANYEAIQADIFDHLLAAAAEFDLRIFQIPSGYDLRSLAGGSLTGHVDEAAANPSSNDLEQ